MTNLKTEGHRHRSIDRQSVAASRPPLSVSWKPLLSHMTDRRPSSDSKHTRSHTYRQLSSIAPPRSVVPFDDLVLPPIQASGSSPSQRPRPITPLTLGEAVLDLGPPSSSPQQWVAPEIKSPPTTITPVSAWPAAVVDAQPQVSASMPFRSRSSVPSDEPPEASSTAAINGASCQDSTDSRKTTITTTKACHNCHTTKTPLWRKGPAGRDLCK